VGSIIKKLGKAVINKIAFFFAGYYVAKYKVGFSYKDIAIAVSTIKGFIGYEIRRVFYQKTLKGCGTNLRVHYGAYIVYPEVKIGNRCTIEEHSVVSLCTIGDDVILAANVSIMSGGNHHELDNLSIKFHDSNLPLKRVYVGNNIWIGTHAVIMADLQDGTVVAAGAVVTRTFSQDIIIGGVPARVIRKRGDFK